MQTKRAKKYPLMTELRVAEALAREAGQEMKRATRGEFAVRLKGVNDLVTEVDIAIETFLRNELSAIFGGDQIWGEEFGKPDGSVSRRWLIDPIDGTLNFSMGIPVSCVSIALQIDGRSEVGVVFEPYRDELFSAVRGVGAYLNGVPISVSDTADLGDAVLATGFIPSQEAANVDHFVRALDRTRGIRRLGSAAVDLAYVACGRLDGFWELGLNPWDTAAAYLLVEEAGGTVTDIDAGAFSGYESSVVATNGEIHSALLDMLGVQPDDER